MEKVNKPKDMIEDLSYSNLVNIIQDSEIKAADCLVSFAHEMEYVDYKIYELEKQLTYFKGRKSALLDAAINKVCKHIQRPIPLAVQRQGFIVVLSDTNLTIEHNVI